METIKYDYNKPIPKDEIEFLDFRDNGKCKITEFKYNGLFYRQEYKYTKSYGFKFIYAYPSEYAFYHPLSCTGSKIIYSSTNENDCTKFGKYLEYSLTQN